MCLLFPWICFFLPFLFLFFLAISFRLFAAKFPFCLYLLYTVCRMYLFVIFFYLFCALGWWKGRICFRSGHDAIVCMPSVCVLIELFPVVCVLLELFPPFNFFFPFNFSPPFESSRQPLITSVLGLHIWDCFFYLLLLHSLPVPLDSQ